MALALKEKSTPIVAPIVKGPASGGRLPPETVKHYAGLARKADNGDTISVRGMSDEEILKLIRR